MPLFLALMLAAPAEAVELSVGGQLALTKDLLDAGVADQPAELGFGPALIAPFRVSVWPKAPSLRAELGYSRAVGWGRVTEAAPSDGAPARELRPDMASSTGWLSVGPEYNIPMPGGSPVSPYVGLMVGAGLVNTRVDLDADVAGAPADGSPSRETVLRPRLSGHLGLSLAVLENMAIAVEAGYSVCRVPESAIFSEDGAANYTSREAYSLNPYSLGVQVIVPLGRPSSSPR